MCIRDRRITNEGNTALLLRVVADAEGISAETVRGTLKLEAVSYTHLRAHETVLDLVCRLLLEKQKN